MVAGTGDLVRNENQYVEVSPRADAGSDQVTGVFYYKVRRHIKYKVTVNTTADRMELEAGYVYDPATGVNVRVRYPVKKTKVPQTREYEEEKDVVELRYVPITLPKAQVERDSLPYPAPALAPALAPAPAPAPARQPGASAPPCGPQPNRPDVSAVRLMAAGSTPADDRSTLRSALRPIPQPVGKVFVDATSPYRVRLDPCDGWRSAR
jgi:hypothetical protein